MAVPCLALTIVPGRDALPRCCRCCALPPLVPDPGVAPLLIAATLQDPSTKSKMEDTLKGLKDDPALGPMLAELESGGPMAMMKVRASIEALRLSSNPRLW